MWIKTQIGELVNLDTGCVITHASTRDGETVMFFPGDPSITFLCTGGAINKFEKILPIAFDFMKEAD